MLPRGDETEDESIEGGAEEDREPGRKRDMRNLRDAMER